MCSTGGSGVDDGERVSYFCGWHFFSYCLDKIRNPVTSMLMKTTQIKVKCKMGTLILYHIYDPHWLANQTMHCSMV